MSKKRILLALAIVSAFFVGYGSTELFAAGYPSGGVYGRGEHRGYFTNVHDTYGTYVLPDDYDGMAVPSTVDNVDEFIHFIKYTKLDLDNNGSGNTQEKSGAAFIIHTMIGTAAGSRNRPPTAAQIAEWEGRVRYAVEMGRVTWKYNFSYTLNSFYQGPRGGGSPNDDAFYDDIGTSSTIVFRNASGTIVYGIRRQCANPVGNGSITPPPNDYDFSITGRTTANRTTAEPGDAINFSHYVRNGGPTSTTPTNINWVTEDMPSGTDTGSGNGGVFGDGQEKLVRTETVTVPNNATAGQQICRRVGYTPTNESGGANGRGGQVCVSVVIPAKLRAAMSVAPAAMAPGDTATFTPVISATQNASPINVTCSITRTVYPAAGGSTNLGAQPCQTTGGNNTITIGAGATVQLRQNTYDAPDNIAVGSRVCDVITITDPSAAGYYNNAADRTAEACVRIAKSPYVHFKGGDVWAGGGFAAVSPGTCLNNADIRTVTRGQALEADGTRPGSGTTYAAFALGRITSFGSAGMGQVTATGAGDNWTFANTNTANLGFFNSGQHCIPDYVANYQSAPIVGGANVNVGGGGNGAWRINGDANFVGANLGAGSQRVYLVNGNVTINNSIAYPASFNSNADVPSLVIIATGDIRVSAAVTQMDGMFISRGTFYTCYPKTEPATTGTCNQPLTINGSVSANRVDLFRTGGADGTTPASQKAPAETFNLSPEVYIRNALNQTTGATITTTNVRELPPRF
jgi:hypothetical protein